MDKNNIGNAWEYYIASRLSAENFIATITLWRAEKYDILAVNPKWKTYKISVKTRFMSDVKRFPLNEKDEKWYSNDLFYAFVQLNEFKKEPDFWIVPSKLVAKIIFNAHKIYHKTPKKDWTKKIDWSLRNFRLELNTTSRRLYPKNREKELKKYYKNLNQLR